MLYFKRGDWTVEVEPLTWAEILEFFEASGWKPNIPTHRLVFTRSINVNAEDAKAFAAAGNIVLEETTKDPFAALSAISFDMGKFAEIVTFAAEGEFTVSQFK